MAWDELGIHTPQKRRREERLKINVPIEVTGFANDGRFFAECTVTADISQSGCSFRLHKGLERGGVIAIKLLPDGQISTLKDEPFLYQVMYATKDKLGWIIGTAKLREDSVWSAAGLTAQAKVQQAL